MTWQPIASAPKDGTRIWAWCTGPWEEGSDQMVEWQGVIKWNVPLFAHEAPYAPDGWVGMPQANMRSRLVGDKFIPNEPIYPQPTHWQPLPHPPKAAASGSE